MARKGRKLDPETEFKHFISSMEEFLHRGQYPSLTILLEGILNYLLRRKGSSISRRTLRTMQMTLIKEHSQPTSVSFI